MNEQLLDLLCEIAEFLESQEDVVDGSYGLPHPNRAMQLLTRLEPFLERLHGDGKRHG